MENTLANIAKKMKQLRLSKNLRIQDVVDLTGLNKETIRKMESGEDFKMTSWLSILEVLDPMAIQKWLSDEVGVCHRNMDLYDRVGLRMRLERRRVRVKIGK
jgi:DNA-binding Xre family transcriptional regulator